MVLTVHWFWSNTWWRPTADRGDRGLWVRDWLAAGLTSFQNMQCLNSQKKPLISDSIWHGAWFNLTQYFFAAQNNLQIKGTTISYPEWTVSSVSSSRRHEVRLWGNANFWLAVRVTRMAAEVTGIPDFWDEKFHSPDGSTWRRPTADRGDRVRDWVY